MKPYEVYSFKGTSSTRRQNWSGRRANMHYFWDLSVLKSDLEFIGWWRSKPEDLFFETIARATNRFCDLVLIENPALPLRKAIHKIKHQDGTRVRLAPYFGSLHWDPLPTCDPDTLCEYFREKKLLRIHYPTGLRPYQHTAFGSSAITDQLRRTFHHDRN